MIAGYETGGTRTDAIDPQRLDGGVLDRGMMGQVEVVVARERQQPATVARRRLLPSSSPSLAVANSSRERILASALSVLRGQNGGNEPRMEALNASQDIKQPSRRGARVVPGGARPCLAALRADEDGAPAAPGGPHARLPHRAVRWTRTDRWDRVVVDGLSRL